MVMATLIPFSGIFFLLFTAVSGQCPTGCFCLAGYVTCSGLTSIPSAFPDDTRSISITKVNVDEIPAGVFDKLSALETIEIYSGTVRKVSSGAFSSLSLLNLISLNELTIDTIEPYAFGNITDIGTISLYMSTIGTIQPYAFSEIFALDEIKLFMVDVEKIDSFAFSNIDELFHFSFYTNDVESMQPYAFSNFSNVHEFSMYLNNIGYLGCGSVGELLHQTYEDSFYSNSVNCSCDITWISRDLSLKKYLFSNWCQVPSTEEKIYWEDISLETLQCSVTESYGCPSFETVLANIRSTISTSLSVSSTYGSLSAHTSTETLSTATKATFDLETSTGNETSSGTPKETFIPQNPISTSTYSESSKETILPQTRVSSTSSETSAVDTHFTTKRVSNDPTTAYNTNPDATLPQKSEENKSKNESKPTTNIEEPQNVSSKSESNDVNGSRGNQLCLFLLFLTLTVAVL